jgi:hypothetical protein
MAKPVHRVIDALVETRQRVAEGAYYQWTHQGACNCGHLAQTLTQLSAADLHAYALEKSGDWSEHMREHCSSSGYPIDLVIQIMLDAGFTARDLARLETLSDPQILARIPAQLKPLQKNRREDLLVYLDAWIGLLKVQIEPAQIETNANVALLCT